MPHIQRIGIALPQLSFILIDGDRDFIRLSARNGADHDGLIRIFEQHGVTRRKFGARQQRLIFGLAVVEVGEAVQASTVEACLAASQFQIQQGQTESLNLFRRFAHYCLLVLLLFSLLLFSDQIPSLRDPLERVDRGLHLLYS
jgi:hypothetical protein